MKYTEQTFFKYIRLSRSGYNLNVKGHEKNVDKICKDGSEDKQSDSLVSCYQMKQSQFLTQGHSHNISR
jgi:hypothetical protein